MWCLLVVVALIANANASSCNARQQQYGMVCVCNKTYCDKAPKIEIEKSGQMQIIFTGINHPGFNHRLKNFSSEFDEITENNVAGSEIIVEIDSKSTYQKIIGFGGSFTDSVGANIRRTPEELQHKILEAYFGEDGLEYTLCRVPIGGSDFSPRVYTLADGGEDPELKKFAIQEEDLEYKV